MALKFKVFQNEYHNSIQGFFFKNGKGALNCSPERFKESCQESNAYEQH